jgi:CheY-like chemotaxis protein
MEHGNRPTILVVDDDQDHVEGVRLVLENAGYRVISASNGDEGLRRARAEKPALIILDILMQHKDGLTAFEELRAEEELQSIPVVMLTSVSEKVGFSFTGDDMKAAYGRGPAAFMEKPFQPERLLRAIRDLIG